MSIQPGLVSRISQIINHNSMPVLILGGAPDDNWLPLLLPLAAILAVLLFSEHVGRYLKKRKLQKINKLMNDLGASGKATTE